MEEAHTAEHIGLLLLYRRSNDCVGGVSGGLIRIARRNRIRFGFRVHGSKLASGYLRNSRLVSCCEGDSKSEVVQDSHAVDG